MFKRVVIQLSFKYPFSSPLQLKHKRRKNIKYTDKVGVDAFPSKM